VHRTVSGDSSLYGKSDVTHVRPYGLDIEMGSYTNGLTSESEFGFDDYYLGKSYLKMVREGKIPMEALCCNLISCTIVLFAGQCTERFPAIHRCTENQTLWEIMLPVI